MNIVRMAFLASVISLSTSVASAQGGGGKGQAQWGLDRRLARLAWVWAWAPVAGVGRLDGIGLHADESLMNSQERKGTKTACAT